MPGYGNGPEDGPVLVADAVVAGYVPGVDVLRGCSVEVRQGSWSE